MFGDTITTNNISAANYMFHMTPLERIPFEINFYPHSSAACPINYMFQEARNLRALPKMNDCKPSDMANFCNNCTSLREIPDDFFDTWDWSYLSKLTTGYSGNASAMFSGCASLRKLPFNFIQNMNPNVAYTYSAYANGFMSCYVLDEIVNLPIPYTVEWTGNGMSYIVNSCYRLKNFTFETPDGQPKVVKWKNQTLDLKNVGYASNTVIITRYSDTSGITADKEVTDDATYQALKNDPDWWTVDMAYSRYNHDSAVATINSLPDASATGINYIHFKGDAGSKTDGGAINTLTEEEIAVAAARGWTVTLS
jgi:hypothetical protein